MEQFKKLKLFPDRWFKKLTKRELKSARGRLTAYTVSKDLEVGISEVSSLKRFKRNGGEKMETDEFWSKERTKGYLLVRKPLEKSGRVAKDNCKGNLNRSRAGWQPTVARATNRQGSTLQKTGQSKKTIKEGSQIVMSYHYLSATHNVRGELPNASGSGHGHQNIPERKDD